MSSFNGTFYDVLTFNPAQSNYITLTPTGGTFGGAVSVVMYVRLSAAVNNAPLFAVASGSTTVFQMAQDATGALLISYTNTSMVRLHLAHTQLLGSPHTSPGDAVAARLPAGSETPHKPAC